MRIEFLLTSVAEVSVSLYLQWSLCNGPGKESLLWSPPGVSVMVPARSLRYGPNREYLITADPHISNVALVLHILFSGVFSLL